MPRVHHHAAFAPAWIARHRTATVSVCLPARDEAATIGPIVTTLMALRAQGVLDEVLVLDDSTDGTGAIAAAAGATVVAQSAVRPELGPVRGKGDAMWRGLSLVSGELVVFLDADTAGFGAHFACGLLGPLVADPAVAFVKAAYRRPWRADGVSAEAGGGRVTELTARPLLRRFFPELAWLRQPLAGEIAAPRALLEQLPFTCGYGVDVALLLDAAALAGPGAIAEVDLDVRQNRHQPLAALGAMSDAVLDAICVRLAEDCRLHDGEASGPGATVRPPMVERAALEAA